MANRFIQHAMSGVASLRPYVPGKPVADLERELGIRNSVKLASNENPLGPAPSARAVIAGQTEQMARYPDGGGYALGLALAQRHNVDRLCITLGNGSNDVLDMVARVFLGPGREAIFSEYAFAVYPIVTQAVSAVARVAPATDYGHDLQAMLSLVNDDTRVIFIANPNNPTGTWLAAQPLRDFLEAVPKDVIVVVDEAYIEYVQQPDYPDTSQWLSAFDNLVVTRTFSKAYGLAALRLGYSLSHPDIADLLNRVRQPFNVNAMAQAAALAALDDEAHIRQTVEVNQAGMQQLTAAFRALGLEWIESVGNFVSVDVGRDAMAIDQQLLQHGVITRPVANYNMPTHLRISIGTEAENQRCIEALEQVLGNTPG